MSKPLKYSFIVLLVVLIAGIAGGLIYFKSIYIDDKVLSGEAYGFHIGASQLETYHAANKVFTTEAAYILHPLDKNNFGPHKKIRFDDKEYSLLNGRNTWRIFFDEGYFNFLELTFEKDNLVSIYRHRKEFELP